MKDNATDRPRVLVLTSTFPRWENDPEPAFIFELSRRLAASFDVTVLSPRTPGSKTQETIAGLNVIRFPYFFQRWEKLAMHGGGILNKLKSNPLYYLMIPFFLLGQLWAVVGLLRSERFDLIHAHWLIPQGLVSALSLLIMRQKNPLLCTSHGGDLYALRGKVLQRLKLWIMDKSAALTVVSGAMKSMVVDMGIVSDKVEVIPMGVDLKGLFTPDPSVLRKTDELLFVGRLVDVKGLEILLEAMPKVLAKYPSMRLTIAGAGPLERKLRELAGELNITDKVDFLGMAPQSKLPSLYQQATLAVFPFVVTKSGIQEGFGLVVVEAMGCACPVIAGDLPAMNDTIKNGENGLLFPSGNTQALADAIIKLLDDPVLRARLAGEGRKSVVQKFDWEVIAGKYAQIFERLNVNII